MARLGRLVKPQYAYVYMRQRLPRQWVCRLRRTPLLRMARLFYARSTGVFPCQGALEGHMPKPFIWSMVYGEHEPHVTAFMQRTVEAGWHVLDVGAHVGYDALLLARCVGAHGRVTAFEPLPGNVAFLRKNIASNGCEQRVAIVPKAAGALPGWQGFVLGPSHSQGSFTLDDGNIRVEVVAVDDVISPAEKVQLVKIDVEGAGGMVLAGMQRVIETQRPIILMENHNTQELAALHSVRDYQVFRIGEADAALSPAQPVIPKHFWPDHRVALPLERLDDGPCP